MTRKGDGMPFIQGTDLNTYSWDRFDWVYTLRVWDDDEIMDGWMA
jgi:hypothetical protein